MPPKSKYASVKTYFGSLLSYAKYVVEQLPGEVIPQKSLSDSSLRRESWRKIIEHGRQLGVPNLPNPESIDSWFPHFKDFKRVHGLKNLQPFGGLQSNKRFGPSIQEKDTTFERLLRELNGEELSSAGEEFEDSDSDSDESEAKSEMSDLSATENESSSSESSSSDSDYDSSASDDDNEIRRRSVPKIDLTLQTPVNARPKSKRREVITLSSSPYPIPQNDVHKPMTIKLKIPQDPAVQIPPPQKIHQIQPTSVASQHQSIRPQSRKIPSHEKKIHQLTAQVSELSVQDSPISTTSDDPSSDLDTMHTPVELIKLLAAGGQAAVFLARLPLDGNSLIVVKVFYSPPSPFEVRSMKAVSLTTYAIRLLGQTRIPISNLVKYRQALTEHEVDISQFELIDSKNVLGFCYERLQGDLESVIISAERKVGNCTKMLVALQIGYFLRGIHAANYIFRDLKPSNILINSPLESMTPEQVLHCFLQNLPLIKVTDFGLVTQSKCRRKTKSAGTIGYMPFEQMTTNTYDKKVDVVAYGITIFELMTDNLLYDISESDEAVEEEFRTLRVIDRMKRRLHLSSRHFHPALIRLIIESVEGRFSNVEPFIQYFEEQFNLLCFVYGKKKHELHLVLPELQRSY